MVDRVYSDIIGIYLSIMSVCMYRAEKGVLEK